MTYARTRSLFGARSYNMPSRFLDELPAELTDAATAPAARRLGRALDRAARGAAAVPGRRRRRARELRRGRGDRDRSEGGVVTVQFAADGSRAPADGRLRAAAAALELTMAHDHRRQGGRGAQSGREVAPRSSGLSPSAARRPGLATVLVGDDPASQIYVAGKHRACAEVGIRSIGHELPADTAAGRAARLVERAERRPGRERDHRPAAAARPPRCGARDRRDRPGEGRRRADADERRPARPGPRRPGARHSVGRDGAAARDTTRRSREPRRSSSGRSDLVGKPVAVAAAGRERHRDGVPLAHARPRRRCAGARTCWSPPSGSPRLITGEMVQAGRDGDRRRHEPHRRRARWATSTSRPAAERRGRSRPSRAASGR